MDNTGLHEHDEGERQRRRLFRETRNDPGGRVSLPHPGGGFRRTKQRIPQWQMPTGSNKGRHWAADSQEFPVLGTPSKEVRNTKDADCSAGPSTAEMDRLPTPAFRKSGGGMRPSQELTTTPHRNVIERIRGVTKTKVTPLSATAEHFTPRMKTRNLTTSCVPMDNELDRSLSRTGPGKIENPHDVIEIDTAMGGTAYPTKMNKPVAMANVAGASGPAVTGAGGPVVAGTRFLAVAEVYSLAEEVKGDPQMDDMQAEGRFATTEEDVGSHPLEHSGIDKWVCPPEGSTECKFIAQEEDVGSHPLEHSGVEKWVCPRDGPAEIRPLDHSDIMRNSASCGEPTEREPLEHSVPRVIPGQGREQSIADGPEQPEEGEAIIVGAVGSAAPWFLTGWTNNIEVEFMIDTGCQVKILATCGGSASEI